MYTAYGSGPPSTVTMSLTKGDGTYYWKVQAQDYIGHWSVFSLTGNFELDTTPPGETSLDAPSDGAILNNNKPAFSWNIVSGATGYQIFVDDNNDFSSPVIDQSPAGTSYTPTSGLTDGTYYWKVRAKDDVDLWGANTTANSFVIDTLAPDPPTLTSPTHGDISNIQSPDLTWSTVGDADEYQVQVLNGTVVIDVVLTGTSYTVEIVLDDGDYQWQVRSKDAAGNWGTWSTSFDFTVDTVSTAAPTLNSPVNGAAGKLSPALSWLSVADADEYRLEVLDPAGGSVYDQLLAGTSFSTSGLPDDSYYRHVKTKDAAGNWGDWSALWIFTIDSTAPAIPNR